MNRFYLAILAGTVMCMAPIVDAFSREDADAIYEAHTRAFCTKSGDHMKYAKTTEGGTADFWTWAEMLEMVLDVHRRTRNPKELKLFDELYRGFIAKHGKNWAKNDFNDDIMWMVIACTRAYLVTENKEYLAVARENFDLCYKRAYSSDLGGGLWWKVDNKMKNACVNAPATIAAVLIYRATNNHGYLSKAKKLYQWQRSALFDSKTGKVFDNIGHNKKINHTAYTYNQGTFVGAAYLLGQYKDARLATDYTMKELCKNGYLPEYGEDGDGAGFNGIGVRWIALYMRGRGLEASYEAWLQKNAEAAWLARRESDQLSWCKWPRETPSGVRYAWGCSNSVVLMQAVRPTQKKQ